MTPWNLSLGYLEERRPAPETLDAAMEPTSGPVAAACVARPRVQQGSAGLSRAQVMQMQRMESPGISENILGCLFSRMRREGFSFNHLGVWG